MKALILLFPIFIAAISSTLVLNLYAQLTTHLAAITTLTSY